MNYDEYAALPGIRFSRLKLIGRSPLHYRDHVDTDTTSRGMLRAIHGLALEPDTFDADFAIYTGKVRRGKAYDEFRAAHEGRTILNQREHDQAARVAGAILGHHIAGPLLSDGKAEHSIQWVDGPTGIECKARLDFVAPGPMVLDLKTYGTTDPRVIARRVVQLGAHVQAAHYVDGVATIYDVPAADVRYLLICAEDKPPFDVAVVELEHDGARLAGRHTRAQWMARLVECRASDEWPGRCPEIVPLDLPDYAFPDLEIE